MPKLSAKRKAHTMNLGFHAEKQQKVLRVPLKNNDGKDQVFEQETASGEVEEDNGPADALEPNAEIHDTLSTLSDLSEDEDLPSSDTITWNAFLETAMK